MTPLQWLLGFAITLTWAYLACESWKRDTPRKKVSLNYGAEDFA